MVYALGAVLVLLSMSLFHKIIKSQEAREEQARAERDLQRRKEFLASPEYGQHLVSRLKERGLAWSEVPPLLKELNPEAEKWILDRYDQEPSILYAIEHRDDRAEFVPILKRRLNRAFRLESFENIARILAAVGDPEATSIEARCNDYRAKYLSDVTARALHCSHEWNFADHGGPRNDYWSCRRCGLIVQEDQDTVRPPTGLPAEGVRYSLPNPK